MKPIQRFTPKTRQTDRSARKVGHDFTHLWFPLWISLAESLLRASVVLRYFWNPELRTWTRWRAGLCRKQWPTLKQSAWWLGLTEPAVRRGPADEAAWKLPSMLSIIFQREGRTDWWKPNHTSLPPPSGLEHPSEGVKKERPTGVYLYKSIYSFSHTSREWSQQVRSPTVQKNSPHWGQMSHDHIQGLDSLKGDAGEPSRQSLVQCLQAHAGHPLDWHFEAAVFAFARNGDLKLHLERKNP